MRLQQSALLPALLFIASPALAVQHADRRGDKSLRWAERQLASGLRRADGSHIGWLYGIPDARDSFAGILAKYGGSARAYIGLGECQLRLGNYAAAVASFTRAANVAPSNPAALRGAQHARSCLDAARAVAVRLAPGQRVLQVARLRDSPRRDLWAVLSAEPTDDTGMCGRERRSPRLALFRQDGRLYRPLWQSGVLKDPRFAGGEWDQLVLDLFHYTGSRVPEVAVWKQFVGGSWAPCHLQVFKLNGSRLVQILSVTSDEDFRVKDLGHDGRYEVQNEYCVGIYPSHAGQYRWDDIYAYHASRGRYDLADRAFPREFRHNVSGLGRVLKQYPGDPQLLEYLGLAQEIEGRPRAALAAYHEAIADCEPDDQGTDPPFSRVLLVRREAALRARLAAHSRPGRAARKTRSKRGARSA